MFHGYTKFVFNSSSFKIIIIIIIRCRNRGPPRATENTHCLSPSVAQNTHKSSVHTLEGQSVIPHGNETLHSTQDEFPNPGLPQGLLHSAVVCCRLMWRKRFSARTSLPSAGYHKIESRWGKEKGAEPALKPQYPLQKMEHI